MATIYIVPQPIKIPEVASKRNQDLSLREIKTTGYRTLGGDRGDILFEGYIRCPGENATYLYSAKLRTTLEDLSSEEIQEIAQEILDFAYDAIGKECIEL